MRWGTKLFVFSVVAFCVCAVVGVCGLMFALPIGKPATVMSFVFAGLTSFSLIVILYQSPQRPNRR